MTLFPRLATCMAALVLVACNGPDEPAPEPAAPVPPTAGPEAEPAGAPEGEAEPTAERADGDIPPLGAPALWTLSDKDTTIHLFGTVHILKPETEWRTPDLDAALSEADAIYFEADVTSPEAQASMLRMVSQRGLFTDGTKLSDLLDPEEERELAEAAEIIGVPVSSMEPMQPWFATVQLSALALQAQGYDPMSGVEMVLTELAESRELEQRFLETAEQQIGFFADMDMDAQVDFLIASAIQIEDEPDMLDVLVEEWAEGDIDDLADLVTAPDAMGSQEVYDVLIVERNANWVTQIETLMEDEAGTFLMAVGAAHLAGEHSVVEMLRAEGYEVTGP